MSSSILRRENGFSLLEVVFACAILAIGMMGYSKIKASSRYSRVFSKQLSQSIQLSSNQLEDFMLRGYNSPLLYVTENSSETYQVGDLPGPLIIGDFSFEETTWTVRNNCPSELTKLVKFTGKWGNSKQLQLTQVQVRP